MSAPKANHFAAKPEEKQRSSKLYVPVTPSEKAQVVKDADGQKLAAYIRSKLGIE